ncbi:MAG: DUF4290 domain-containing protein [Bacteroidota bacterium]
MKYKISEKPLILREFGRNVQGMVEYALTVEDRDKRNQLAKEIVRILTTLNPQLKEVPEYKQKLWDSLFLMSNFQLDVDSPYPIPATPEEIRAARGTMPYVKGQPRYKQYGRNVQMMIEQASEMEDEEQKMAYLSVIANTMQQFLFNRDQRDVPQTVIAEHIRDISDGRIRVKPEDLIWSTPTPPPPPPPKSKKRRNKRSSSSKRRRSK